MANQTEDRFFDRDKYGFDYRGTLDLNFDIFPEVSSPQWMIDKGLAEEGDVSNIITQLEGSDEKGWYLFPTMKGGKRLENEYEGGDVQEFLDINLGGKHFGMFETYEEGMKGDSLIHQYFKKLKGGENVNMTAEDKIIDLLK
jgi:hypothetical protein|tara:strand:+ start:1644 stop:2069 length:426 start_codon:yes stop_codon:yes gene_type:complete